MRKTFLTGFIKLTMSQPSRGCLSVSLVAVVMIIIIEVLEEAIVCLDTIIPISPAIHGGKACFIKDTSPLANVVQPFIILRDSLMIHPPYWQPDREPRQHLRIVSTTSIASIHQIQYAG
ncbi:predicted protein [Lichtheimia corymbifera JMRC:FSU:9682]|uniref:Uncharacterized protein n=1 Tax=Lichtheimia corymbifera JMRC:FSU:9682 TaxID=1263082 RepID=A0A068SAM6_9FUNG|nr:predicted protein [Lichtheimia corymbifera JMRC:FSU:9682]